MDTKKPTENRFSQTGLVSTLVVIMLMGVYMSYVGRYGVNVLYWDDWNMVPVVKQVFNAGFNFHTVWQQHNENRMFFPNLVFMMLAYFTHFDTTVFMYFSCLLLFVAYFVMYTAMKSRIGNRLHFIPLGLFLLSLVQYENTLWAFQVAWYMILLLSVVTFVLLLRPNLSVLTFVTSIGCAIICSFSSLQGLIVWPVGLTCLCLAPRNRMFLFKAVAAWCAVGLACVSLYFFHFDFHNTGGSPLTAILQHPLTALQYFLDLVGSVVPVNGLSEIVGLILVTYSGYMFWFILRTREKEQYLFPLAMVLFGLLFDFTVMVGRSGFGVEQAASSRYTTYNLELVAGLYLFVVSVIQRQETREIGRILQGGLLSLLILQVCWGYQVGVSSGQQIRAQRLTQQALLEHYKDPGNEVQITQTVFPSATFVQEQADFLRTQNLSVFHFYKYVDVPKNEVRLIQTQNILENFRMVSGGNFSLDVINGKILSTLPATLKLSAESTPVTTISGWATDAAQKLPGDKVYIGFVPMKGSPTKRTVYVSATRNERLDVAKYFGVPAYKNAGWAVSFPTAEIPPGTYSLKVFLTRSHNEYFSFSVKGHMILFS